MFFSFSTIVHVSLQEHSKASEVGGGGGCRRILPEI